MDLEESRGKGDICRSRTKGSLPVVAPPARAHAVLRLAFTFSGPDLSVSWWFYSSAAQRVVVTETGPKRSKGPNFDADTTLGGAPRSILCQSGVFAMGGRKER
eukprot:TRINITY_DN23517_c0_g1_i1.p2 TRINITY_DN23517_c0_g1~~TRINITY_DN23517_c0_g1_i1.p2  ORF type:complete len:103 (-),score=4.09 TRINITY_DN23517_c0_g1_i1:157-465(-)